MRVLRHSTVPATTLAALALVAVAAPSAAAVRYTAVTESSDGGKSTVHVESDGPRTRIEFRGRGEGTFQGGDVLVTEDGGDTVFLLEPKARRYMPVDLDRVARIAGRIMEGIPGLFYVRIEEPSIAKLFEEDGPTMHGVRTRHTRYLMTYREVSRLTLPRRDGASSEREQTWNHLVQDVWWSDEVPAVTADVWLRERFRTGYEDLDRLLSAEAALLPGFPLRVETVRVSASSDLEHTRVRLSRARDSVSQKFYLGGDLRRKEVHWRRSVTDVTELEVTAEPLPADGFRPPADYAPRVAARGR